MPVSGLSGTLASGLRLLSSSTGSSAGLARGGALIAMCKARSAFASGIIGLEVGQAIAVPQGMEESPGSTGQSAR